MTLSDVKAFLLKEYGWFHANIAAHPYIAVGLAFILGFGVRLLLNHL